LANGKTELERERQGIFYGWYIVAAMFFTTFVVVGARTGFGVFIPTWEEEFGTSVGLISVASGVGWAVNGLVQPLAGHLTDVYGGRRVMIASVALLGLLTMAIAAVPNVYVLIFVNGVLLSSVAAGLFPTPSTSVLSRWFVLGRGKALSLVAAGGSAGGIIMIPFAAYLLILTDWRTVWFVFGLIVLGLGLPAMAMIVRNDPSEMDLEPDGGSGPESGRVDVPVHIPGPLETRDWRESFRSAPMWQLSLGFWVCGVTTASIGVHFVKWAGSEGISIETAALAFGALSAINALGVIVVGSVSDRMQRKNLLGAVYLIRGLAVLCLIMLPGTVALWTFAVLGGASWLATVPLTTGLTADVYGLKNLGTINGLVNMFHQLGGGLAVVVFGVVFDIWGSYDQVLGVSVVLLIVAGALSFAIRERRYSIRYQSRPIEAPTPSIPAVGSATDRD